MITLGIETSCDETSAAILKGKDEMLSNVISSSLEEHQPFGGVVPEIASRHCLEAIDIVYRKAVDQAKIRERDIELIAVTQGPGLIGSLLVGVSFAKALSFGWKIPLVAVNHLEAHLDANFIEKEKPKKPFIGLLVSGGHTSLVYYKEGAYKLLGETVDDAVGEAYDKVARVLGLGYPGGPQVDKVAGSGNPKAVKFTKPKIDGKFDFSFSGIKTAVCYHVKEKGKLSEQEIRDLCASFQEAVIGWLVEKTLAACDSVNCSIIVTGGGVTANSLLRRKLAGEAKKKKIKVFIPPMKYTTDNAAMVARNGVERFKRLGPSSLDLVANPSLAIAH